MAHYTFTTHIDAPVDVVFDLWTNLDRMVEWVGGVTKVTANTGPTNVVGAHYTIWFGRMKSRTEVVEADRPTRFATRFGNRILRGETHATFEPDASGTQLTQTLVTDGLISAIAARIFATGSYRGSFRGEIEAFRRLAEREASKLAAARGVRRE
jgi:uncharacterized protein YndB with AHSA1/START domain